MLNIKKGNISLDITFTEGEVQVKRAPGSWNYMNAYSKVLVSNYKALASGYLKLYKSGNPAAVLMAYFKSLGYTVSDLLPKTVRNELGDFITLYRL